MPYALDRLERSAARRALAGAVLLLSLGVGAGGAAAQTGNRPQSPAHAQAPAAQKPGTAQSGAAPSQAQPEDAVATHLAELKKQLDITAAQQPKFDEFAKVVKQNAETMDSAMQKMQQKAQQNAVENLRAAASLTQTEADNLKRLVPALEALYGSLTEQQKHVADEMFSSASPSGAPQEEETPSRPPG